jgi:hypothetical protein
MVHPLPHFNARMAARAFAGSAGVSPACGFKKLAGGTPALPGCLSQAHFPRAFSGKWL